MRNKVLSSVSQGKSDAMKWRSGHTSGNHRMIPLKNSMFSRICRRWKANWHVRWYPTQYASMCQASRQISLKPLWSLASCGDDPSHETSTVSPSAVKRTLCGLWKLTSPLPRTKEIDLHLPESLKELQFNVYIYICIHWITAGGGQMGTPKCNNFENHWGSLGFN